MHTTKDSPATRSGAALSISVLESAEAAQEALEKLERAGFDTSRLSIIGKEEPSEAHQLGLAVAGAQARAWGRRAALWSRVADSAAAMALAWVPFIGHIVAVGPAASVLADRHLEVPARARSSALERMLTSSGMPAEALRTCEAAVRGGQILLLMHGERDAARARHLLRR